MAETFSCEACGYDWFVEERVVRLAGHPSEMRQLQSTPRDVAYRLRCFNCGRHHYPGDDGPVQKKGGRKSGQQR